VGQECQERWEEWRWGLELAGETGKDTECHRLEIMTDTAEPFAIIAACCAMWVPYVRCSAGSE